MAIKIKHSIPGVDFIEKESSNSSALNVLITGVFHGEEPQGEYIIEKYLQDKDFNGIRNNMYFIPCLNPYGRKRNKRGNKNGVDLNRNFPTKDWQLTSKDEFYSGRSPASEEETKFILELLDNVKPAVILTLHAPLKCVNFDGPASDIAKKISKITGYPVQASIGYPTPGSFGTYCGIERNIPTITLEFDNQDTNESLYTKTEPVLDFLSNLNKNSYYL